MTPIEPFSVKHYAATERPIIKGHGFDGLEIGEDREEAQAFIDFVNSHINPSAALQGSADAEGRKDDSETHKALRDAVRQILNAGYATTEDLMRLRDVWEAA